MILNLGPVVVGATVYVPFHTFAAAGNSVTLTGLAVTAIEIFKDGSVTQRASDAGYTLLDTDGIDFDGITGLHGFKIDLSDNTDSGFFAAGHVYMVAVSAVTVDGQTVNFWAAMFEIVAAYATLAEIADAVLDEDMTGHQTLGTLGQAIGDPVADTNTIYKAVVTDAAGTNIAADIIAIEGQTDDIGVAGAGLTAVVASGSGVTITQGSIGASGTNPLTFVDGTVRQTN